MYTHIAYMLCVTHIHTHNIYTHTEAQHHYREILVLEYVC